MPRIELHVSNSLDELAETLVTALRARRARPGASLFDPVTVVVPNRALRAFLQLAVARRLGIAANLDLRYLSPFVASLVPEPGRLVGREELEALLLGRLHDEALLARPALAPVVAYLRAAGEERDAVDRRRAQLAAQLAAVFDDYAITRPDLLAAWRRRPTLPPGSSLATTEAWERELWRSIFGEGGALERLARDGTAWLDAPALLERDGLVVPEELHVFGFSYFAPLYQRLLGRLARTAAVHVYTFTPCAELRGPAETPLRALAAPSREHLDLWRGLEVEPAARHVDPLAAGATLLRRVQRELLHGDRPGEPATNDGTIRVLACPSLAREVEIVAGEVWELVRGAAARGERLRFDEVGVLLVGREQEAYRSQLVAVFAQAHGLPVNVAGLAGQEGRLLEAVRLLLELPLGTFKRGELLRLLTHPNVVALVPDAEPEEWIAWAEELDILGGADRADLAGTYVTRDLHTWDQGLKRLALGAFMTGPRGHDDRAVRVGADDYLPLDLAQGEAPGAARLALLVRALVADARCARDARPLAEWARFLQRLVLGYLAPAGDAEEQLLDRCARRLRRLEELDLEGTPVGYRIALELARGALEDPGGGGRDLAEGVVVAPLGPARPIPFKVAFVLGLGEGAFPAAQRGGLVDLRAVERRAGDVEPPERDRHAFLELLAATRDRLVLSYVARDASTGEDLAPSSVVRALEAAVAPHLRAEDRAALTTRHPLRRYAAERFAPPLGTAGRSAWTLPEAFREAQVRRLREAAGRPLTLDEVAPEARAAVAELLGLAAPPPPAPPRSDGVRVSIAALLDFLTSPLQAWAKHRLRLREERAEGDPLLREDEVFEPTALVETVLLREAAFTALARGAAPTRDGVAPVYDELAARGELDGTLPTGVFLAATRAQHLRLLEVWLGNLAGALDERELRGLATHRFGPADERGASDVLHGPLVLELGDAGGRVELHGRTSRVLPGAAGAVVLVPGEQPDERHALRAFLDHVVLAAQGLTTAAPFRAHVVPGVWRAARNYVRPFRPFAPEEARAYLRALVADFVGGPHAYLFPLEAALESLRGRTRFPLASSIRWRRDNPFQRSADRYGPLPRIERYEPPAAAEELARRRLGEFVRRELSPGGGA